MTDKPHITQLLRQGDSRSFEELFPIVYGELRQIAGAVFRKEYRDDHTLQPTALVHEAFIKLVGSEVSWQSRAHFYGIAALSMRQILVKHAEARNAEKRGGRQTFVALDDALDFLSTQNIEILTLHEALERFALLDRRQSEVVELKFFGGLTIEEIAEVLNISPATVKRDWEMARGWLYRELKK